MRHLRVVPTKKQVQHVSRVHKKLKNKKKNIFVEVFRTMAILTFLLCFGLLIFPTCYHRLIKQVFYPTTVPTSLETKSLMYGQGYSLQVYVDFNKIARPINCYLYNALFKNTHMLVPTVDKSYNEVTTMYHTSEMVGLKNDLFNLMNSYPSIKPSIYVWEYEQGQYVDINADKLYSAASIIKLPILVKMFKSIEANQFTIYDEMTMLEQYRSSGSGNLQYYPAGKKYSIDSLAKTMIQDSDNTATNMIMAKIGGMDVSNAAFRDWGLSKTYIRTWLPDLKGTNKITAAEIAKVLYNLDNPGFLNINSREYIVDYMSHVKNDRLIQAGLGDGALFIHKTGDIGTMLGDAGIVYAPNGNKYIVVILAERPYNSPLGKDFIVKASNIIYHTIVK